MIDTYNSKAYTWIKWVHTGLSTYCYYNEATSWIDFVLSRAPGGGIMQAALRRAFECAKFLAEFQKNSEKSAKNFGRLQPINCNR